MCNPAWHPVWKAAAKLARTNSGTVFAVFGALEGEGDKAARLSPAILSAGLGFRAHVIARVLVALDELGVTTGGIVTPEWRASENRTPDAKPDALPDDRTQPDTARVLSTNPSSVRSWRKYWRDKAALGAASKNRTRVRKPDASSFSLFPEDHLQEKKQTKTRECDVTPDAFDKLWAVWPVSVGIEEAKRAYRAVLREAVSSEVHAAAERYVEKKPDWQSPMHLHRWLSSGRWKDQPVLPLSAAPRVVVETEDRAPREDWLGRFKELRATGMWKPDWGPPPGQPGCRIPSVAGIYYSIARWFADHPPQIMEQPERARG